MSAFDLVIKNGTVITMDKEMSKKRWIAVKDGLIAATGSRDDFSGEAKTTLDLKGRSVLPGLIDTHAHVAMTGFGQVGIDLAGVTTVKGILDRVREFCEKDSSDKVVFGCNMCMLDQMEDRRIPNRFELDKVSGDHPVMLILWTAHGGVMNSKAIEKANLLPEMEAVRESGFFNEDKTSIHVMGNIYNLMTDEDFVNLYEDIGTQCASRGITTVCALEGMMVKEDRDVDILMTVLDKLPIEFIPYTQTFNWQKIYKYGLKQIGGCLCIDGSPPQLTAAYQEPYPCAPHTRGFLNYTDRELYDYVTSVTKAGMQVGFHAIGDRAIDQIIHIYQQVDREIGIKHLRHRIEHFSLPSERNIEMAAEMNLVAACQPVIGNMIDGPGGNMFESFCSKEKSQRHENFSIVMKGGVTVCGGSDSPVSPLDAFAGIDAAVNAYNPARRVSLDDALKLYTFNAAWACHQEDKKGSLEVGKEADLIIVNKDPYSINGCIDQSVITVEETYKKGKIIFRK